MRKYCLSKTSNSINMTFNFTRHMFSAFVKENKETV